MMPIITYPSEAAEKKVRDIARRDLAADPALVRRVADILQEVRTSGDAALIRYVNEFDAPALTRDRLKVTEAEMTAAESLVDPAVMSALKRAASQIESFHRRQIQRSWIHLDRPGTLLGQIVNPVAAAGVYAPGAKGGTTPLVSSVLMGAIPAVIAGVRRIVMVTPPMRDGSVNPYLLSAARLAGVTEVYRIGSAWAVAALAYGTETVPRCDVIVGPGNIYVTLAKKQVAGTVGIDMAAGPSEVLIIADEGANPEYAAADMLSQAEHDPLSSAILVTDAPELARKVQGALARQVKSLVRRDIAEKSLAGFGAIIVVPDIDTAIGVANAIAPEHLELHIRSPFDHLGKIRNAGAVFLGDYTPEPMGDYIAGPNHVLPTSGTARFSSPLSVDHFIKKTSVIHYSRTAFLEEAPDVVRLAEAEGLGAHARSVAIRMAREEAGDDGPFR